jgi:hypothetical protein
MGEKFVTNICKPRRSTLLPAAWVVAKALTVDDGTADASTTSSPPPLALLLLLLLLLLLAVPMVRFSSVSPCRPHRQRVNNSGFIQACQEEIFDIYIYIYSNAILLSSVPGTI